MRRVQPSTIVREEIEELSIGGVRQLFGRLVVDMDMLGRGHRSLLQGRSIHAELTRVRNMGSTPARRSVAPGRG